jgi:dTDP-4-amino-4,6-dideoxygalactose transaminase
LLAAGPQSLEEGLADFLGGPRLRVECSGTAALVVALTALKRRSARRRVIVPAYTCPLVAMAILHCGLIPVPCDVRSGDFQFDPGPLAGLCDEETLAVIPTHLGGRVADLEPVREAARRRGVAVIEDAAQALGAFRHDERQAEASEVVFYSLAVGKGLTIYEGGVLVSRNEELRHELDRASAEISARRPGQELRRCLQLAGYASLYRPSALRFVYGGPLRRELLRGNLIEAVGDDVSGPIPLHRVGRWRKAVGANALRRLPVFLQTLHSLALQRLGRLSTIRDISVLGSSPAGQGTWPFFMVLMPTGRARDAALKDLWGAGFGVSRLYIHALAGYPYLAGRLEQADTPHARDLAARMLTVTNSPWLENAEFGRVILALAAAAASA